MLETQTTLNQDALRELNAKLKTTGIVCLVVGCIGLTVFVFLSCLYEVTPTWAYLFLIFAIPFVFGLVEIITISNIVGQAALDGRVFKYQFEGDFFMLTETKFEEKLAELKIYYKDLVKIKQTKNFIFLFSSPKTALPIKKSNLTESDLQALLKLIQKHK